MKANHSNLSNEKAVENKTIGLKVCFPDKSSKSENTCYQKRENAYWSRIDFNKYLRSSDLRMKASDNLL